MRYAVPGMVSPDPLARRMPAAYAEDALAQQLLAGCDDVLAPIYSTLDNLWAYFDPDLTPPDFLEWLSFWVAAEISGDRPLQRRRTAVARAVEMHHRRGTAAGLAEEIFIEFGVRPEIVESGATTWSSTPSGALPGDARPWLIVRLRVPDPSAVPLSRLRAAVEAACPAHVPATVEVLASSGPQAATGRAAEPPR